VHVIIIGAGPAGITAAETITNLDNSVECTVLTAENLPPYSPPVMYDHFINGFDIFWKGKTFDNFEFCPDTAVRSVDFKSKQVTTAKNRNLHYDKLIIASGSSVHSSISGFNMCNVYNFKSLTVASELIEQTKTTESPKAVVIGAGLIGIEISMLLNALHTEVVLLEKQEQVLPTLADPSISDRLIKILRLHGIRVILKSEVLGFMGNGKATEAVTGSGEVLKADFFVIATGNRPQIGFLKESDIRVNSGICIDRYLKSSIDSVFAIGDCAESSNGHHSLGIINNNFYGAVEQARICAHNVLGDNIEYESPGKVYSVKHIKVPLFIAGSMSGRKIVYCKKDELRIVFTGNNRIVGFQLFNSEKAAGVLTSLMRSKRDISQLLPYLASPHLNHSYIY
jgi:nitrite reductase (NADH) large subunit